MQAKKYVKQSFLFATGLATGLFVSNPVENNTEPKQILPIVCPIVERDGYKVIYDGRHRNPHVVIQLLTKENLKGEAKRATSQFKEDPAIPKHIRASLADYKYSKFDRGHMAPAGDCKQSSTAMDQSFLLTNICPQSPELNRVWWAHFEKHVRGLTEQYKKVEVFTGPLYLPTDDVDGKRYVHFSVIGPNDVAVPTHFFKLLHLESENGRQTEGYIVPNIPIDRDTPLEQFHVPTETIERLSGIIFSTE
jgi:endonuclease G, mitochondrial